MKTFSIPVSDCDCFVVGQINKETLYPPLIDRDPPRYGVIVWYDDKETARQAAVAVMDAHWPTALPATEGETK